MKKKLGWTKGCAIRKQNSVEVCVLHQCECTYGMLSYHCATANNVLFLIMVEWKHTQIRSEKANESWKSRKKSVWNGLTMMLQEYTLCTRCNIAALNVCIYSNSSNYIVYKCNSLQVCLIYFHFSAFGNICTVLWNFQILFNIVCLYTWVCMDPVVVMVVIFFPAVSTTVIYLYTCFLLAILFSSRRFTPSIIVRRRLIAHDYYVIGQAFKWE